MKIDEAVKALEKVRDNECVPNSPENQAIKAILPIIKNYIKVGERVLPKKMIITYGDEEYHAGFNACREEVKLRLLKRLISAGDIMQVICDNLDCGDKDSCVGEKNSHCIIVSLAIHKEIKGRLGA